MESSQIFPNIDPDGTFTHTFSASHTFEILQDHLLWVIMKNATILLRRK